jgi:heme-degrading monooxygenase HmoA
VLDVGTSSGVVRTKSADKVDEEVSVAVVMEMFWPEASLDQYEQARERVAWEDDTPDGAIFHVAWMGDDGFHVVDVWESEAAFNAFAEQRLMPVVKGEIGIEGDPQVTFSQAHRIFDAQHNEARS